MWLRLRGSSSRRGCRGPGGGGDWVGEGVDPVVIASALVLLLLPSLLFVDAA